MTGEALHIVLCNGAKFPRKLNRRANKDTLKLFHNPSSSERNVNIQLPDFVGAVYHLPDRIKDLLENVHNFHLRDFGLNEILESSPITELDKAIESIIIVLVTIVSHDVLVMYFS